MKKNKTLIMSLLFYSMVGLGISLTLKSNIGVSSFNSMNVAISSISGVKVGFVTTLFNLLFLIGYIGLTRFRYRKKYVLQIIATLCLGYVINFFTYVFIPDLSNYSYVLRVFVFIIGTIIAGISTGMVLNLDMIAFPIESFCSELSNKTGFSFAKLRYSIDIFSVGISLMISVIFNIDLFVREGTIISLFLLSATITWVRNIYRNKKISSEKY